MSYQKKPDVLTQCKNAWVDLYIFELCTGNNYFRMVLCISCVSVFKNHFNSFYMLGFCWGILSIYFVYHSKGFWIHSFPFLKSCDILIYSLQLHFQCAFYKRKKCALLCILFHSFLYIWRYYIAVKSNVVCCCGFNSLFFLRRDCITKT